MNNKYVRLGVNDYVLKSGSEEILLDCVSQDDFIICKNSMFIIIEQEVMSGELSEFLISCQKNNSLVNIIAISRIEDLYGIESRQLKMNMYGFKLAYFREHSGAEGWVTTYKMVFKKKVVE